MRLVTWNCGRGAYESKASGLLELDADVVALQEVGEPTDGKSMQVWQPFNPGQGVAVRGKGPYSAKRLEVHPDALPLSVPAQIEGPVEFVLLSVWAHQKKGANYVDAVLSALDAYEDLLSGQPAVVMGDFNANAIWNDKSSDDRNFAALHRRLTDLGLVSAYHHFFAERPGAESRPTLYWRWQETSPFHVDYCYVPEAWVPRLQRVAVPDFRWGKSLSDHRPLIVDFEDV